MYHTLSTWAGTGFTLGKVLVGTRVVSSRMALLPDGHVQAHGPGLWSAFVRSLTKTMTWLCLVVFLAAIFDPSGQVRILCLHSSECASDRSVG